MAFGHDQVLEEMQGATRLDGAPNSILLIDQHRKKGLSFETAAPSTPKAGIASILSGPEGMA